MAIGVQAGNDLGGASLETQFHFAGEVGGDVLKTATTRGAFTVNGEKPTFTFLEPQKFSSEYVSSLEIKGEIDPESVKNAKRASYGLSVEAALQITEAKPTKNKVVEEVSSLFDIARMLGHCEKIFLTSNQEDLDLLSSVAGEIAEKNSLKISGQEALVGWAKEKLASAKKRIDRNILIIEEYSSS